MRDIDRWLRDEARGMIAIYGQHDPWSGGKVTLNRDLDSHVYTPPNTTHATFLRDLTASDYAKVRAKIMTLGDEQRHAMDVHPTPEERAQLRDMLMRAEL